MNILVEPTILLQSDNLYNCVRSLLIYDTKIVNESLCHYKRLVPIFCYNLLVRLGVGRQRSCTAAIRSGARPGARLRAGDGCGASADQAGLLHISDCRPSSRSPPAENTGSRARGT